MVKEMVEIGEIRQAREIIGDYGETAGIICPHCGGKEYPYGTGGKFAKCSYCGNVYELPLGYGYSFKRPDSYLEKAKRAREY